MGAGPPPRLSRTEGCGEKGVRSAQKMQVGPCIPVGIQLEQAEDGPTSGPAWHLSHLNSASLSARAAAAPAATAAAAGLHSFHYSKSLKGPEIIQFVVEITVYCWRLHSFHYRKSLEGPKITQFLVGITVSC